MTQTRWHACVPEHPMRVATREHVWGVGIFLLGIAGLLAISSRVALAFPPQPDAPQQRAVVTIQDDHFLINGKPTYEGRVWNGKPIEGLLLNSRMVQGIFDDSNPDTVGKWAYPDTGRWDPERNTNEFIAAMPSWRAHGLLAFTINLQGGSPQGYSQSQPWINSAIAPDGSLREPYMTRLARIIDTAEQLQMVVILGYFYFGQDQQLQDEAAVLRATDNATRWILEHGWRHVLIEINNECNVRYDHDILKPSRVHELIERVKQTPGDGYRLLVSTSYGGGTIPDENVVRAADFLLLHGNGVSEPKKIAQMVQRTRQVPGYTPKPILFNEDDHFDFDKPQNNFTAAIGEYAGWGYFDFRQAGESFQDGYQSVPVDWSINSPRKRGFFQLLSEITGESDKFRPGQVWLDTEGRPIQAHGGCVLYHDGTYYWYGENKDGPTLNKNRVDIIGISCYSSRDLYRWKFEGVALKAVPDDPQHDLHPSRVCERPKVVFNEKTGKFVMWVHIDDAKYQYARTGVAIADQPTGPFQYIESFRPNGGESRDMTVFKDDDGKAYVIFGSGWHTHVQIAELTDDYLKPSGKFTNHFQRPGPPTGREAPAVFKNQGRYYMITSGTTGWACNEALYAVADSMHGPWTEKGNPCVGPESDKTFRAQSTFVLPVAGKSDAFIFLGDRWNSEDLRDSRYVWLPIEFTEDGIRLTWRDAWDLSVFDPSP